MENKITAESIIEKVLSQRLEKEKQLEIIEEKRKNYTEAVNRMASTRDGKFVLQTLIEAMGIFAVDNSYNSVKLVEDNGMKKVYLKLIRPYLEANIRKELE